jgi:hypothetical protein
MNDILIAPSLIFISPEVWANEYGRDSALQLLLDYLDRLDELRVLSILWSNDLEALMWSDPVFPPWRIDRDWKLKLVPVIANKFQRLTKVIEIPEACEGAGYIPDGSIPMIRPDIASAFLQLSHESGAALASLAICLDQNQPANDPIAFKCDFHTIDSTVRSFKSPKDILCDAQIMSDFWSAAQIKFAVDINSLLKIALKFLGSSARYVATYSSAFVKEIATADNKRAILESMAKRISKSENEAGHDHGLCDESVKATDGLRRFRVTKEERIHYSYTRPGEIFFLKYFREGRHDDGL